MTGVCIYVQCIDRT